MVQIFVAFSEKLNFNGKKGFPQMDSLIFSFLPTKSKK
jgi:hypothetical protein